jgi:hypothetical protein
VQNGIQWQRQGSQGLQFHSPPTSLEWAQWVKAMSQSRQSRGLHNIRIDFRMSKLGIPARTFIESFHRTPAPRHETSYVTKGRHDPLRD